MAILAEIETAAMRRWQGKTWCAGHLVELKNVSAEEGLDLASLSSKTVGVTLEDLHAVRSGRNVQVMVVGEVSEKFAATAKAANLRLVDADELGEQKISDVVGPVRVVEKFLAENRALIRNDRLLCAHYA